MPMTIPAALAALTSNPEAFLKITRTKTAGQRRNGPTKASMQIRDNGVVFFNASPIPGQGILPVWSFRMIERDEPLDLGNVDTLHVNANTPRVILTGELTGCVVLVNRVSHTELHLAHIQPGGKRGAGGPALEKSLAETASIGGGSANGVFGPSKYENNGGAANVIGVYTAADGWTVWGQVVNRANLAAPPISVHRIV